MQDWLHAAAYELSFLRQIPPYGITFVSNSLILKELISDFGDFNFFSHAQSSKDENVLFKNTVMNENTKIYV